MINGVVNANLEATIRLVVVGPGGKRRIRAVIDTGFNGSLTLPAATIAELGLKWKDSSKALLADGSAVKFDIYVGQIVWDRRKRSIWIDEADTTPLIGTGLLEDHEFFADFCSRGKVTIRRRLQ
jgi:clan AA aspartic protease